MANLDVLKFLYSKRMSPLEFKWEMLKAPPLLSLLTPMDVYQLNKIATSNKLSTKVQQKYSMIDSILVNRGFKEIASGTNRVCYKYLDDQSICIKVAIDKVGMRDNPAEYKNQYLLAPFVTKMFEMSPCGTVGLFERVEPITCREEFLQISDDIFDLIVEKIIGKYVVQDIGSDFFQNFGLRVGWGPVILDFPYVYELDGAKMLCTNKDPITGEPCLGEIDYDNGFNNLICTKCGKIYLAKQLEKQVEDKNIIVKRGDVDRMKINIMRGTKIERTITIGAETKSVPITETMPKAPVVYTQSSPKRSKKDKPSVRHEKPQKLNNVHRGEPEYKPVQKTPVTHSIPQPKPQQKPVQTQPAENSEVLWTNHYYCGCGKFYGKKNIGKLCRVCNTPVEYHDEVIKFKPREKELPKEEPKQEIPPQQTPVQESKPEPVYEPPKQPDPEPEARSVTPPVQIVKGEGESAEVIRDTSTLGYSMGEALKDINLNPEPEEEPENEQCNSVTSVNDYAPNTRIPGRVPSEPEPEEEEQIDPEEQMVEVKLDRSKMEDPNVGKSWDNPLHINELQITYDEMIAEMIDENY